MTEPSQQEGVAAAACPSTKQLRLWLDARGELSGPEIAHLAHCSRCQSLLALLSDDPALRQMATAAASSELRTFRQEPELDHLRSALAGESVFRSRELDHSQRGTPPSTVDAGRPADCLPASTVAGLPTTARPTALASSVNAESLLDDVPQLEDVVHGLPARYTVDSLLACGGAAAVYKAFDVELAREVAIKVLSRNSMRDRQRFLREARVLAELEHPNIVRVLDVGTLISREATGHPVSELRGQLYLVLEYMPGGSATSLCRAIAGQPGDSIAMAPAANFRQLAALMACAADGLHAAHQRGLVHRDVKPGNLLLNANRSQLKVADFGLARSLDAEATQVTRTGELLGTPAFMSPEQVQAEASVTELTDVYSLGATLYQLLTGVLPFQGTPAAILRQVAESRPIAPRLLRPTIPIDLATICLHAMEQDPAARYRSMAEFADDLRRFESGEPIRAQPVSPAVQAVRYLRRHKTLASTLAACVLLVILLTGGSLTAAAIFQRQNQRLLASAEREREAKESAEQALKESMSAADELLLAVTTETEFLPRTPGSQEVTRKLLLRARDYFQEFLARHAGNARLTHQLARAHAGLAEVAFRMGDAPQLEEETLLALELIDQIPKSEIDDAARAALRTDTIVVLANHFIESGEAKQAIPWLEDALRAIEAVHEDQKVARSDVELKASQATALLGLANAFTWVGRREEAFPLLGQAKQKFVELLTNDRENPLFLRNAAACDLTYATTALDMQQAVVGKQHLMDALELINKVGEDEAISLRIREMKTRLLTNLALAERRLGNNLAAKAGYEAAIEESRRLIELEPGVPSHAWNLVVAGLNSGGPDMELGLLDDLLIRWQNTLPVLEQLISNDPDNQRYLQVKAMLHSNIAILLRDMGKLQEAIEPLQSATEILRGQAAALDFSPEAYLPVAINHYEMASTWLQLQEWENAEQEITHSDGVVDQILEREPAFTPALGQRLDNLFSRFELESGRPQRSAPSRRQVAMSTLELARELATSHPDLIEFRLELPVALLNSAETLLDDEDEPLAMQQIQQARTSFSDLADEAEIDAADLKQHWIRALTLQATAVKQQDADLQLRQATLQNLHDEAARLGASPEQLQKLQQ